MADVDTTSAKASICRNQTLPGYHHANRASHNESWSEGAMNCQKMSLKMAETFDELLRTCGVPKSTFGNRVSS